MKRLLLLLSIATMPFIAFGQKKEMIEDKEAIMARAARALDSAIQPGTDLHEAIIKEKLIGKYLLQVSFREKGDISSVFVVNAEAHDQRSQNRFKDLVHQLELPFRMPKGRQYRIEHVFDLNAMPHE